MKEETKEKLISAITTTLLLTVAVVICAFVGFKYPNPPIQEEGVEVNLGNSNFGLGTAEQPDVNENKVPPAPSGGTGERIAHQNTEATEQVDADGEASRRLNNTVNPSNEERTVQPTINQNALFKKRTDSKGGSEGVTQGTGNQGNPEGDPNSTRYSGDPGNGGSGWKLEGRGLVGAKPVLNYSSNEQGKNVVKIWVDRNGKVVRAEPNQRGSTITKPYFAKKAKEAAQDFRFTEKPEASELQIGYVTCVFSNVD
ncbi:MAG: hypothetical protein SPJ13_03700 [Bacteroidales bacterium]|nr:hypothetical protein [Bacteroidales bacterium]